MLHTTEDEIKYIFVAIVFKIPSDLDLAPHYKLLTLLSTLTLSTYTALQCIAVSIFVDTLVDSTVFVI